MIATTMRLIFVLFALKQQCVIKCYKFIKLTPMPAISTTAVKQGKNNYVLLTPFQRIQNLINNEKSIESTSNRTFVSKKTIGGYDHHFVYNSTEVENEKQQFIANFHKHEALIKLQDINLTNTAKIDIINSGNILDNIIILSKYSNNNINSANLNACDLWKKWNKE